MDEGQDDSAEGGGKIYEYDDIKAVATSIGDAGPLFVKLRAELDAATAAKSEAQKRYDFIRKVILPKLFEEQGITSTRLDPEPGQTKGKGIRIQDQVLTSCLAANKPALIEWLKDHGEEGMVKETVHPQTLTSFVKDRVQKGQEYPEELVKLTIIPTAQFY